MLQCVDPVVVAVILYIINIDCDVHYEFTMIHNIDVCVADVIVNDVVIVVKH